MNERSPLDEDVDFYTLKPGIEALGTINRRFVEELVDVGLQSAVGCASDAEQAELLVAGLASKSEALAYLRNEFNGGLRIDKTDTNTIVDGDRYAQAGFDVVVFAVGNCEQLCQTTKDLSPKALSRHLNSAVDLLVKPVVNKPVREIINFDLRTKSAFLLEVARFADNRRRTDSFRFEDAEVAPSRAQIRCYEFGLYAAVAALAELKNPAAETQGLAAIFGLKPPTETQALTDSHQLNNLFTQHANSLGISIPNAIIAAAKYSSSEQLNLELEYPTLYATQQRLSNLMQSSWNGFEDAPGFGTNPKNRRIYEELYAKGLATIFISLTNNVSQPLANALKAIDGAILNSVTLGAHDDSGQLVRDSTNEFGIQRTSNLTNVLNKLELGDDQLLLKKLGFDFNLQAHNSHVVPNIGIGWQLTAFANGGYAALLTIKRYLDKTAPTDQARAA